MSILKFFCELGKFWKFRLGFLKIPIFHLFYELGKTSKYTVHSPRPTLQNPNFGSVDELGKVCPNLSFSLLKKDGEFT